MDAPERIWVDIREETLRNFGVPFVARGFLAAPPRTEYVRADALAAKDAEIERLTLAIENFNKQVGDLWDECDRRYKEAEALRARIAEKDEALREISTGQNADGEKVDFFQDIARKALEG